MVCSLISYLVCIGEKNTYNYEIDTPPKINIDPENDGLEDDFSFPGGPYSQVPAVNLLGCKWDKS